jgi:tetratricopeptide (TPR) repeat protein
VGGPNSISKLAEAYSAAGNRDAAIRWYKEALRRQPGFRAALEHLGVALIASGNIPRAVEVLEGAMNEAAGGGRRFACAELRATWC